MTKNKNPTKKDVPIEPTYSCIDRCRPRKQTNISLITHNPIKKCRSLSRILAAKTDV